MYRQDLDVIKGVAIIAVVLFHIGLLKSGYLGVDAFFVINGFLIVPSVIKQIQLSSFSLIVFLQKRIVRLLPLIVIACIVALGLGYFLMLPDDYENLSQAVIASNCFSENILEAITTKNYWDQDNGYKPLMHLWYVGILFEFYLLFPLTMLFGNWLAKKLRKSPKSWMVGLLSFICVVSMVLYLVPTFNAADKFYIIPFRFFEMGLGGLAGVWIQNKDLSFKWLRIIRSVAFFLLLLVIFCSIICVLQGEPLNTYVVIGAAKEASTGLPVSAQFALLLTVFTAFVVVALPPQKDCNNLFSKVLIILGKMSYSIFIWHQLILAFYRYSISNEITLTNVLIYLILVIPASLCSYYLIERKIVVSWKSFFIWVASAVAVMIPSGLIYLNAGVMRDVPELEVYKNDVHRGMFAEYCDRVYSYKDFSNDSTKIKVLVEGYSFGRDFANVLLESEYADKIDLCYAYLLEDDGVRDKVSKADFIFVYRAKNKVPEYVWEDKKQTARVLGIGTKNYGFNNGQFYINRGSEGYFSQVANLTPGYYELNQQWKEQWGDDYVDLLDPVSVDDSHVKIFTDDNRFISQDCRHLMPAGAKWYARILNFKEIFENAKTTSD